MSADRTALALASDDVIDRYARRAAEIKSVDYADLRPAFAAGITTVYRGVAFDIDGTLTRPDATDLDEDMARVIGELLQRAVPVTLVTGRGRAAARTAAAELRAIAGLSAEQVVRLSCITHNGLRLLETEPGADFLGRDVQLCEPLDVDAAVDEVARRLDERGLGAAVISREPGAVRIAFGDEQSMRTALEALAHGFGDTTYVTGGRYADLWMIDVSPTTKALAIEALSARRGLEPERILRIGDQGAEEGNDYALLNSVAGWSVDRVSGQPGGCWPVLNDDLQPLHGADATRALMQNVLLFAPLTLQPENPTETVRALRRFERAAERRARREALTARSRLRLRVGSLLAEEEDPLVDQGALRLGDMYDLRSGGVRLRDWELDDPGVAEWLGPMFDEPDHHATSRSAPECRWSMYTDTALLLRGPVYYWSETAPPDQRLVGPFLEANHELLQRTLSVGQGLMQMPFAFGVFKLLAGVFDHVRNALLQAQVAAYNCRDTSPELPVRVHDLLAAHTAAHLAFLFDADGNWRAALHASLEHFQTVHDALPSFAADQALGSTPLAGMRECDSFVENIMAVEIGLRKLRRQPALRERDRIVGVGLLRGGVELPVLAEVIAGRHDWAATPALLSISTYSNERDRTSRIRAGDAAYVQTLREEGPGQLVSISDAELEGAPLILMDDNCTTATTLQNARDLLVLLGFDVLGAVVVRYPGVNRQVHMALPKHGLPDPEALFGFIRGLVAPSPYTRLLVPGETADDVYRDQRGVFNKSKNRIERYLHKNGTPALDDAGEPVTQ